MLEPLRKPLKQRTAIFPISATELAALFQEGNTIEIIKGLPEDAVILSIDKPVNQNAYAISVHSETFPESNELDLLSIMRNELVQYAVSKDKRYITTTSPYNRFQRLIMKLIGVQS